MTIYHVMNMPPKFRFTADAEQQQEFQCPLQCEQCVAHTRLRRVSRGDSRAAQVDEGRRCRKRACVGVPYCWMHLRSQLHLRIKASSVASAGKGLFAEDPRAAPNAIVFRPNDIIVVYGGERVTRAELEARYGDYTAPYGLQIYGQHYEDAACRRGPGALANHAPSPVANARYSYQKPRQRQQQQQPPVAVLKATKAIRNGQEILVSYGPHYRFDEAAQHQTR